MRTFTGGLRWLVARSSRLPAGSRLVLAADLAWIAAAAALLALVPEALTAAGRAGLVGVSLVVAGLVVGQWVGLRRLEAGGGPTAA